MALWTALDLPPQVSRHRSALEAQAAAYRKVYEGKPFQFDAADVPRLAFLAWRIEDGRLDPRERL